MRRGTRNRGAGLEEIERVYREEQQRYERVATAILHDREEAREAVQEAFARAVRSRSTFRREGDLEAWLWRTLTNVCLDVVRRTRRNGSAPPDRAVPAGATEPGEEVRAAVGALPERQRLVLFLRYYADLPYEAIGRTLGIERGTVAATLHAAHAAVRRNLKEVAR